jgi:hypothetical protein
MIHVPAAAVKNTKTVTEEIRANKRKKATPEVWPF